MNHARKKILISNVYSWRNKGDAAIVLCMIERLKSEFGDPEIHISSIDPSDKGKYGESGFQNSFLCYRGGGSSVRKPIGNYFLATMLSYFLLARLRLFGFFSKIGLRPYFLFGNEIAIKIRKYGQYDVVIAAGGGYFITKGKQRKLLRYLNYNDSLLFAYDFFAATFFGKPFVLYSQSIGPFHSPRDFDLLRPFLAKANIIMCREDLTMARLADQGLTNITRTEDVAFNLEARPCNVLSRHGLNDGSIKIGMTVRECLPKLEQSVYEFQIAKFISTLLHRNPQVRIIFMPQVVYESGGDNDLHTAERIQSLIEPEYLDRVNVLYDDLHPSELKYVIGQMNYFIGTRFHSCIFALSSLVRTVALSYEPKTNGIMHGLGMSRFVIDVTDVTAENLMNLLDELSDDGSYYSKISTEVDQAKRRGSVNLAALLEWDKSP
jgi:colanic acid/amylovoran biosynthesis protein WcaK/AmsJ